MYRKKRSKTDGHTPPHGWISWIPKTFSSPEFRDDPDSMFEREQPDCRTWHPGFFPKTPAQLGRHNRQMSKQGSIRRSVGGKEQRRRLMTFAKDKAYSVLSHFNQKIACERGLERTKNNGSYIFKRNGAGRVDAIITSELSPLTTQAACVSIYTQNVIRHGSNYRGFPV